MFSINRRRRGSVFSRRREWNYAARVASLGSGFRDKGLGLRC